MPSHLPCTLCLHCELSTKATLTPDSPLCVRMALLKSSAVSTSWPSLIYLLTCAFTVAAFRSQSLASLGITKINSFNEDSRVARHSWTGCKKGGTVITPRVILAEVGCCYLRVILLDGLQNMLHYPANSVTFLGGVLYDVDHGLVLNNIFKLSHNHRNVPRNSSFSKQISLVLSKLLW